MSQNSTKPDKLGQVADAITGNWVDNLAPIKLRPYLRLSRADRPIGTWLLLIPCWWGLLVGILEDEQVVFNDFWLLFSCSIGAFLMRGAGCTWNDILDRKIDGAVERTRSRPIPSGQVTLTQAIVWMMVQIALAGLILLSYNFNSIILGLSSLFLVVIYPFAKKIHLVATGLFRSRIQLGNTFVVCGSYWKLKLANHCFVFCRNFLDPIL